MTFILSTFWLSFLDVAFPNMDISLFITSEIYDKRKYFDFNILVNFHSKIVMFHEKHLREFIFCSLFTFVELVKDFNDQ